MNKKLQLQILPRPKDGQVKQQTDSGIDGYGHTR